MDIRQIRYFLCLCETMNFSRASQELGISQPTLSRSIQRLETEVGLLLYRDGKNTRLTALAKALRSEFAVIDECEKRARQIARGDVDSAETEVTIGMADSFGPKRFDRFLLKLVEALPNLRIKTREICATQGPDGLLDGTIDVVISGAIQPNPKLASHELFSEPLMLGMANTHTLATKPRIELADLKDYSFVDLYECPERTEFLAWARSRGVELDNRIVCHRQDWVQRLVVEGDGVTVLSGSSLVTSELTLRPVAGLTTQRPVFMHTIFGSPKASVIDDIALIAKEFDWRAEPVVETECAEPAMASASV